MAISNHDRMDDAETSLRAENAELRRLLEKHQWAGLHSRQVQRMLPGMFRPVPTSWQRASARMRDRGYLGDHGATR